MYKVVLVFLAIGITSNYAQRLQQVNLVGNRQAHRNQGPPPPGPFQQNGKQMHHKPNHPGKSQGFQQPQQQQQGKFQNNQQPVQQQKLFVQNGKSVEQVKMHHKDHRVDQRQENKMVVQKMAVSNSNSNQQNLQPSGNVVQQSSGNQQFEQSNLGGGQQYQDSNQLGSGSDSDSLIIEGQPSVTEKGTEPKETVGDLVLAAIIQQTVENLEEAAAKALDEEKVGMNSDVVDQEQEKDAKIEKKPNDGDDDDDYYNGSQSKYQHNLILIFTLGACYLING